MYSINSVALDNDTYGWSLLRASQMLTGLSQTRTSTSVPGRHGVIPSIPAYRGAPTTTLVIKTPGTNLALLYRLLEQNGGIGYLTQTADASRRALYEVLSIDPQGRTAADETVVVTVTLRFPTADWRDTSLTTVAPATVSASPHSFTLLTGIEAAVSDADIFIGGNFGTFSLVDTGSGSWLATRQAWPYVSGSGVLYQGSTGRAFRSTVADPWTPGADMSGYIDVSGGGGFRITPDPAAGIVSPYATLTLTTGALTSLTKGYRVSNAYLLRDGSF